MLSLEVYDRLVRAGAEAEIVSVIAQTLYDKTNHNGPLFNLTVARACYLASVGKLEKDSADECLKFAEQVKE